MHQLSIVYEGGKGRGGEGRVWDGQHIFLMTDFTIEEWLRKFSSLVLYTFCKLIQIFAFIYSRLLMCFRIGGFHTGRLFDFLQRSAV